MAAISTIVAATSLALAIGGTAASMSQQRKARRQQAEAADAAEQARMEQSAQNAAANASETRAQIREERVRRAQVMQAAANTGTAGSSGEQGALSSLSSQFSGNLGFNQGAFDRGNRISALNQRGANAQGAAQAYMGRAGMFTQFANLGGSIFSQVGGFDNFASTQMPRFSAPLGTSGFQGLGMRVVG